MLPGLSDDAAPRAEDGLSIYLHWPFCRRKCPYCDFNSHATTAVLDVAAWRRAYETQIVHFRSLTGERGATSIYFGGGTPSLMPTGLVAELIDLVNKAWPLTADAEITLEANPSSADREAFRVLRGLGVNRLSLGVQALDDGALRFLRRTHTLLQALRSMEWARDTFPQFSIDLIYGRPGQGVADWRAELARTADFALDHLSAYQLTIEEGTPFSVEGIVPPPEDLAADLFLVTEETLADRGLPGYEIANHARPGHEGRHNLAIWRGGDYLGIGPGAHGRLAVAWGARCFRQESDPDRWLKDAGEASAAATHEVRLAGHAFAQELLLAGLRLAEGVSLSTIARRARLSVDHVVNARELQALVADGLLSLAGDRLRLMPDARLLLDELLRRLLVFDPPQLPGKLRCPSETTVT